MPGRGGLALLDRGGGDLQHLALREFRQRVLPLLLCVDLPAGVLYRFPPGREAVPAAAQLYGGFRITIGIRDRPEQAQRRQLQNLPFPQSQGVQVRAPGAEGG